MKRVPDLIHDPSLVFYADLVKHDGAAFMSDDAYGHLCTVTGATWDSQGRTFDPPDDKIDCGASAALDITGPMTLEIWLKFTSTVTNAAIADKWGASWALTTGASAGVLKMYFRQGGASKGVATLGAYNDGNWHHVFGLFDGANVLIEVDGTLATGDACTAIDSGLATVVNIGGTGYGTLLAKTIGEVRIYNRLLFVIERQQNNLATKWRY